VGRVWPRHGHRGRPLNSVVRRHMKSLWLRFAFIAIFGLLVPLWWVTGVMFLVFVFNAGYFAPVSVGLLLGGIVAALASRAPLRGLAVFATCVAVSTAVCAWHFSSGKLLSDLVADPILWTSVGAAMVVPVLVWLWRTGSGVIEISRPTPTAVGGFSALAAALIFGVVFGKFLFTDSCLNRGGTVEGARCVDAGGHGDAGIMTATGAEPYLILAGLALLIGLGVGLAFWRMSRGMRRDDV
jgi:hypothetical protein